MSYRFSQLPASGNEIEVQFRLVPYSVVGIVTMLMAGETGVRIPAGGIDVFLLQMSTPDLGPAQSPVQWVPEFCPGGKAAGLFVDRSYPFGSEVRNDWTLISTPSVCVHGRTGTNLLFFTVPSTASSS